MLGVLQLLHLLLELVGALGSAAQLLGLGAVRFYGFHYLLLVKLLLLQHALLYLVELLFVQQVQLLQLNTFGLFTLRFDGLLVFLIGEFLIGPLVVLLGVVLEVLQLGLELLIDAQQIRDLLQCLLVFGREAGGLLLASLPQPAHLRSQSGVLSLEILQ